MQPTVKAFFDKATWTLTYVVFDEKTRDAVIIDPVWDYDPAASKVSEESINEVLEFVKAKDLKLHLVLETHAHADHLTGSQVIKDRLPGVKVAIGAKIRDVQKVFQKVFSLGAEFMTDGSQFDLLLEDGQTIRAGSLEIKTIHTPGHTPACVTYVIGDAAFTGDALFMPDSGTGRCDFPAGSANDLYTSVHDKLYRLPDSTRVFVGHDYQPDGRELRFESSIGEEKRKNVQLKDSTSREDYVRLRQDRDAHLAAPRLLLPSVQINIAAGRLPVPDTSGTSFLKIPIRR